MPITYIDGIIFLSFLFAQLCGEMIIYLPNSTDIDMTK